MKKMFAFLLCVAMLASLTACGLNVSVDTDNDAVRGEQNVATDTNSGDTNNGGDANTNNGGDANTNNGASANEGFSMGSTNGLNYENKFIGIGCNLDSNWTFKSDAEIRQQNQQTLNAIGSAAGKEWEDAIKEATIVYDMSATHSNQTDTININLEKSTEALVAATDLNQTYQAVIPTIKATYEGMGFTNVNSTITTAVLDGKTVPVLRFNASYNGISFYALLVMLKCSDGYVANISIGTFQTDGTDALLGQFYWTK